MRRVAVSNKGAALLSGQPLSKARKFAPALAGPIEQHRRRWAELLAWIVFSTWRHPHGPPWEDFAITARELMAGRPFVNIPLMHHIAELTVGVHASNAGVVSASGTARLTRTRSAR